MDSSPEVPTWFTKYLGACGDEHLVVSFGDTRRIVGRRGYEGFGVNYPTDLLLSGED